MSKQSEFAVRVPKRNNNRRYSVLKFNGSMQIDTGKWASSDQTIQMFREDNKSVAVATEVKQDYGEGSEYGKAAREEARRKKYGRISRSYQHDNQPWMLNIVDSAGKEKKYRSIREGGTGEHADYWVFLKSGEEFHAYKVDDWYQFLHCVPHRTLDIDQAEERYSQRNKVMNQFALKAQIQQQLKGMEEDGEKMVKGSGDLKIKDEASSDDEQSDEEKDSSNLPERTPKPNAKGKKKNDVKPRKDKKQRVDNADDIAAYESDDGDDEGREYDYITDSGSDSDRDVVPMEQKVDEAMVGVGDEQGLKKLIGGDLSDSDSSNEEDETKKLLSAQDADDETKKRFRDIEERDSSGSDSDDPDKGLNSAIFLQMKTPVEDMPSASTGVKRPNDDSSSKDVEAKRPKLEEPSEKASSAPAGGPAAPPEGLNEETVRRYLRRKPHTTKELLSKIKSKCGDMEKSEIVQRLAAILKRIEPHQFKQKHGKKEVLFFSLNNTLA